MNTPPHDRHHPNQTVSAVLQSQYLPLHGVCAFADVADRLLPCRGLTVLRDTFRESPAQSVIVALFPYRFSRDDREGNLSRYARVPDYHRAAGAVWTTCAELLRETFPDHRFLPFLDNSPIPEVRAAALAGLGCVGDHDLLIHSEVGSWVFIAAMVTDLSLISTGEGRLDACLHCGACAAACPGQCIGQSRDNCLSRVTQQKGELTEEQAAMLRKSGMVWGCDRCQEVCPLNDNARIQPHPCFGTEPLPAVLTAGLLEQEGFLADKAYAWRGETVLRRNLSLVEKPEL